MRVVRRIFRQVADGQTLYSIKRSLEREGVPAPEGGRYWNMTFLRNVVLADVYRPHSYTEMEKLVAPEVAACLDKEKLGSTARVPHAKEWRL
jgi:Recombinase